MRRIFVPGKKGRGAAALGYEFFCNSAIASISATRRNSSGANGQPCRMPVSTGIGSDNNPFTTNRAVVLWWRFRIWVIKESANPKYLMTSNRKSRETVSYALRKSSNRIARLSVGSRSGSCAADNRCAIIMPVLDICQPCTKPCWGSWIGTPKTFWTR